MIIFITTARGHRGSMYSDFTIEDKESFLKTKTANRFSYVNSRARLLKDMSLKEFEEIFQPTNFTPKQITSIFRKDISDKYGMHKIKSQIQTIKKKDLVEGSIYEGLNDNEYWLYLGKCSWTREKGLDKTDKVGLLWKRVYKTNDSFSFRKTSTIVYPNIIKGIKKLKKLVLEDFDTGLEFSNNYSIEGTPYRSKENYTLTIDYLK